MIQIERRIEIKCSKDNFEKILHNFNIIYPQYSPDEHIRCEYLRGNLLTENSILYFEEYISGKKQKMKYRVVKVTEQNDMKIIHLKAMFPRSLFNIRASLKVKIINDIIEFERKLTLGTKALLFGMLMDKLTFLLGKTYLTKIQEHEARDLYQLKDYIENKFPLTKLNIDSN